jgi:chloramphenicol 3-O phosphotransferase
VSGKILFLNGTSSAGKTTLAKALQETLPDCWQHVALDQFRDGLPDKYRGLNAPADTAGAQGLNVIPDQKNGQAYTRIHFGDAGQVVLRGMRRAMRALVDEGVNIIIDDIILEPLFLTDYLSVFEGCEIWFVGVRCDLAVIDAREQARPGRFPGTAFGHADICHAHGLYDVEVNTGTDKPQACANKVISRMSEGPGTAFNTLRENSLPKK